MKNPVKNLFAAFSAVVAVFACIPSHAQFVMQSGDNTVQISGLTGIFYQDRFLKPGLDNFKNNEFSLRNLQLELDVKHKKDWRFKFKVDFAKILANTGGNFDPENPGISNVYVEYRALPVKFKLGFDKLPYSQGSINDVFSTPFWSRGILTSGAMFSRRDLGLTLHYPMLNDRINLYGGVYSGLGENVLTLPDADPSGQPEYVGRIDFSYPTKNAYTEVDMDNTPTPIFRAGLNGRYTNKTVNGPTAAKFPADSNDAYFLRLVNGKKLIYGFDACAMYRGFSAQIEYHIINIQPSNPNDRLFMGTTPAFNGGKVNAGGLLARVYYNSKPLKSTLSLQYENINVNDLITGNQQWLSVGYAYLVNGYNSVFKVHYYRPLQEDVNQNALKYTGQVRVGYQYQF